MVIDVIVKKIAVSPSRPNNPGGMKSFLKFSFLLLPLVAMAIQAGDWPQWRGVSRDGVAIDEKPLSRLPAKAQMAWQIPVGKGQGGLVLADGKLLVLHETNVGGKPMETAALVDYLEARLDLLLQLGILNTGTTRFWLTESSTVNLNGEIGSSSTSSTISEDGEVITPDELFTQ